METKPWSIFRVHTWQFWEQRRDKKCGPYLSYTCITNASNALPISASPLHNFGDSSSESYYLETITAQKQRCKEFAVQSPSPRFIKGQQQLTRNNNLKGKAHESAQPSQNICSSAIFVQSPRPPTLFFVNA